MSILIKGMKMPKNKNVYIRIAANGEVYVYGSYPTELHNAIEIPKHGRLIDVDAFFEDICNDINAMTKIGITVDGDWLWEKLDDALGHAPTIIETEK